jgi:hypothetical protein
MSTPTKPSPLWQFILLIPLALLLTFCSAVPAQPQPTADVAQIVSATLTAYVPEQIEIQPTIAIGGSISGRLGYPSDFIPPLKIVAFRVGGSETYSVQTTLNQTTYRIENLPEGKYNLVAYALNEDGSPSGLAGGYTQAVLCGLTAECTEHGLVDVIVFNGEESIDADILDWYTSDLPPMP